jgi:mannose/cellobiose epimerase-like protein (N-acyl-D-glucosamine 2-epimerase family)
VSEGVLGGLSSAVLAALCTRPRSPDRLELKIDNVFLLASRTVAATRQAVYSVVFAAASPLPRPVLRAYQTLSMAVAAALMKEEANARYLSQQAKLLNDLTCEHQNLRAERGRWLRSASACSITSNLSGKVASFLTAGPF